MSAHNPGADPIRVAILGLGSIGRTHAAALAALGPGVELVAASGGGQEPLEAWPDAERVSPQDLLTRDDVDLLAITSPSDNHAEHAAAAIKAGMSVVIEKPIATTTADASMLLRLAREHGRQIYPIAQRRLEDQHVAIRELLQSGQLGQITLGEALVHWHRDADYYAAAPWRSSMPAGGSLMNQGLHSADLLLSFLGPIASVSAHTATLGNGGNAEDTAAVTLAAESGALGVIVTSTATPPGDPALLTLRTTKGLIDLSHTDIVRWQIEGVPEPTASSDVAGGSNDPAAIGIAGHVQAWQDITAAWRAGAESGVRAVDAWRTVAMIDAAYTSAATGRRIEMPEEV
ncbi:MAG TPA: Gfo/Idh/MocA family oxidoreductase [Beutenbergiaceae bacterium]|nr:Gfo/Idh/MocA family oxidoreductase [Beutenbergiaceae bacterium]